MLNMSRKKYNVSAETAPEQPVASNGDKLEHEIQNLKETNTDLTKQVAHLCQVLESLKYLPNIMKTLQETVNQLSLRPSYPPVSSSSSSRSFANEETPQQDSTTVSLLM